jgi:hypothetical protein
MFGLRAAGQKHIHLAAVAIAASLFAYLSLGSASADAASWSIQTTPNGSGAEHSTLDDIACEPESTNACTAVGQQTISGTTSPYAQYWNGSTWVNQTAAVPAGATAGEFQANHCLSKTSCVAAGSYATKSGTFSLVESWNGTSWSQQTSPNPGGATETKLRGVSCKAISACIAVGYSNASGKWATAMRGNAGTWTLHTVPKPAESTASELAGVECNSTTSCVAVGAYNTSASVYWAMVAVWNGTEWSLQSVPKPAGAKRSILLDVSCSDASNCTAVGGYMNSSGVQVSFAARWNGSSWTQQTTPNPGGSSNTVLQNISCNDRYSCVAVGDWLNSGIWKPMAQYWNNAGWSLDTVAIPAGATFGLFDGVACRITCLTSGWYTDSGGKNKTLGEVKEIPSWTLRTMSEASTKDRIVGISCPEASACVGVGSEFVSSFVDVSRTFLWNGTSWSASSKPAPAGAMTSKLVNVSCSAAGVCTAVGDYSTGGPHMPFAARYASGSWTVQSVPFPAGSSYVELEDVSCASATSCVAVGKRLEKSVEIPYIAAWNGTSWSSQTPAGANNLFGISCTASNACMAVGSGPEVERWNGSSWSVLSDPANAATLSGVSCLSASECTVAGRGEDGQPFASKWNGSSWTQLPEAPRLAWSELAEFEDISCPSSSKCYAVGYYTSGGNLGLLAADWNGTSWTLHDVPKSASTGILRSVSCATITSCQAAGVGLSGGLGGSLSFP